MPATWMMDLNGSVPADVSTACPSGIAPIRPSSRNGWSPPRFLIAPDTPWGISNHHGMMFRFHALTIASTSWSSRSPSTMVIFIRCGFDTEVWGFPTIVFYADQHSTLAVPTKQLSTLIFLGNYSGWYGFVSVWPHCAHTRAQCNGARARNRNQPVVALCSVNTRPTPECN